MSKNEAREIFLAALHGEKTPRPAVATVDQSATYEQMDILGVKWPDANMDAKLMAKLAAGAHSILGFDAVKVPFCQTIEQEALGCTINPGDDKNLPSIKVHPYQPEGDSLKLKEISYPEDFLKRGRVPVLIEAVKLVKAEVGDKAAVIGGIVGPFSITSELIEITGTMKVIMKNPAALEPFMKVATRCGIELAGALVDAGADAICIEDMMASVSMISPKHFKELVLCWETELIKNISAPTILHICGRVDKIVAEMIATGATAISFEPKTNIDTVKEAVKASGRKVGIIGGIDTMDHLFYGDSAAVQEGGLHAIEEGYTVIAPSCSIPPATRTENLKAMVQVAHGTQ
jgi:[methyl-Co(III) methanol-specific corrinoid protein]:coenzyme M methyltransferase